MPPSIEVPRIKRLSAALANQIAAGEVIERPASVVKELLENCLDAGASRIVIDIRKAGSELIRVSDNGHGIHPEDLQLALERHATAKLNSDSDLAAIRSLGFRGEALPSISSVASMTLTSRIDGIEEAARLNLEPASGRSELTPAAHPVGTTVEVQNLFHNTPARKKFLRSERTEYLHILEMVRRLALCRFDVTLELRHNGQRVLNCRAVAGDPDARVASLLGTSFSRNSIHLDHRAGDMRLRGWLGVGELARSATDKQYLYLNGRMIRDKRLNHAIRLACEGHVPAGRFPSYVLFLEMDVRAADVNVHPTKHEVRFRHPRDVHDFLHASVSRSLAGDRQLLAGETWQSDSNDGSGSGLESGSQGAGSQQRVAELRHTYGNLPARRQAELIGNVPALGQALLQLEQDYILTQRQDTTLLVNIEAAKKHIALAKLQSVGAHAALVSRPLLVPISFRITAKQEDVLRCLAPLLEEYAVQVELGGPASCVLRSVPAILEHADMASLVEDLLNLDAGLVMDAKGRDRLILTMVRHVHDIPILSMSREAMANLLQQLADSGLDVSLASYPPIWTAIRREDLDRMLAGND